MKMDYKLRLIKAHSCRLEAIEKLMLGAILNIT